MSNDEHIKHMLELTDDDVLVITQLLKSANSEHPDTKLTIAQLYKQFSGIATEISARRAELAMADGKVKEAEASR